uniref:Hemicentin-1-like n=1 Tax=Crassostrea virginica TaxID=6565 RepID=A0A8B8C2G3_CRAVI|nr:hemicentin-1-like [Crassostrea virginica]
MEFGLNIILVIFLWLNCQVNRAQGVQTYPLQTLENSHPIDITIPDVLKLNSGEDISIPCNTSNTEPVTTTWNYKTGIFPRNVHQLGKNLVITSADHSDSGIYLCHVNSSSQVTYKLLEIIVDESTISSATSLVPPKATLLDHKTVLFGENVTVTCHVTGTPLPTIVWLLNDRLIKDANIVEDGNRLHIHSSLKEDGVFTCVAKSVAGEDRAQTNIYVVGVMPIIDFLSDSMYVLTGSSVSFRCHASGIPKPNIFWYFIGVNGEVGFPESNYQISSDHSVLTIHSARQSGTVWCIARNAYGATNEKAYLWIRLPDLVG